MEDSFDFDRVSQLSPAKRALLQKLLLEKTAIASKSPVISERSKQDFVSLSVAQQRLWFLEQLSGERATDSRLAVVHLKGDLQIAVLELAVAEIVRRHQVLRTTFSMNDGTAVGAIAPARTVSLPVTNLQQLPVDVQSVEVQRLAAEEARESFDLTNSPLLRVGLLRQSPESHVLLVTIPQIVGDRSSIAIFIQELATLYQAFSKGLPSPLPELSIQYTDVARQQHQSLSTELFATQLDYWKQQLKSAPPLLELPADRPRPPIQTFRGAVERFEIDLDLTRQLKALSQQSEATLFITLLAAFVTLLSRYGGSEDIIVGSPIDNRQGSDTESLIGLFVNTLVLRTDLSGNPSFQQLLGRVRERTLSAYACQNVPFEKLIEELQPEWNLNHNPLFQAMFVLHNPLMKKLELPSLTITPWEMEISSTRTQFDLTLFLEETEAGLTGGLEYSVDLFDASTITRMLGHFQTLLEGIVADPQQRVSELPLLTRTERHQLLVEWNDTQAEYPRDTCIHHLFESQAKRTPNAIAATFKDQQLTYWELNVRANQLAHHLREIGVGPDVLVALCVERSLEMVVGLLGILKAGGAYVPLDPTYPQDRLAFMLSDSRASVLLTRQDLLSGLAEHEARAVLLDADLKAIGREGKENPVGGARANNLAYTIYTSGSTGQPKGVLVTHQSLCNLVWAQRNTGDLQPTSRVLQIVSLSFDAATSQVFATLCSGATLCLADKDAVLSSSNLVELLRSQAITHAAIPVSLLEVLPAENLPALQTVITGGEACSTELVAKWAKGRRFFNEYGPTEATVCTTVAECFEDGQKPSIGRPIANTQVYILDPHLQPVPIGIPGELHIAGVGLARGYLNHPDLTEKKFILNPFSDEPGTRLYKTGDLVRYLPNGKIEFLGRLDNQVKIRGYRIELGEIEALLAKHPAVGQAVVAVREDRPGDKRLVAYVVPERESIELSPELSENQQKVPKNFTQNLGHYLREQLPNYMVPDTFAILDALPQTPNGKIDRRALPVPDVFQPQSEETYVMPQTEAERLIAEVWQELLPVEKVGIHDNFFHLGGHSLLVIKVQQKLQELLGQELSVVEIFQYPTIHSLAKHLSQKQTERLSARQGYNRANSRSIRQASARQKRQVRQKHRAANRGKSDN